MGQEEPVRVIRMCVNLKIIKYILCGMVLKESLEENIVSKS